MTSRLCLLTVFVIVAALSLPAGSAAAQQSSGIRQSDPYEFSSRNRYARVHRVSLHYYDSFPWWWHPPYVKRARTYYLSWPVAHYPPDYDHPYPHGVVGFGYGPSW